MRLIRTAFLVLGVVGVLVLPVPAISQEQKAKAPDTTPPAAAAPAANANRPAATEYQRLMDEWKTTLADLRKLKVQYQTAALADQARIQQEWQTFVDKGNQTVTALESAGLKAYSEAPNEDPQL